MYNPYGISYAGILGYQYLTPSGVISERLNIGAQINLTFAFLPAKAYDISLLAGLSRRD